MTGAFLAQEAEEVDDKLNVRGGVVSRFTVGPDRIARFHVVVLMQRETDNTDRGLTVDVLPPAVISDEPLRVYDGDLPEAITKSEIGFAIFPIGMTMRFDGRWRIVVTAAGGGGASLPLNVHGPNGD